MSVQAGIWNLDGRPIEPELLADFSQSLKHQGPDGAFLHVNGSVGLLYRPFHTTAESRSEEQPYVSGRGFILTWDGRLDNRHDLTAQFRRDLQASSADIAIVAAAFDRLETNCFREIIGDWAIAVWKPEQRELILAVDYMAIRHIFYRVNRDQLMWSTDLAALVLFSGDHFRIDDEYVAGYLASDPNAQVTPYREIRQVPPGQVVHITDGRIWTERYWVTPKSRICYKSDAGYEEHFRHVFRQSVRRRLRSDSPILADLSGGLDSSSIVCMADDILAKEGAQTPRLDTLSYYDKTEPNGDDWIYFQKLEELRGRVGSHIDLERCTLSVSLEYPTFAPLPGAIGARHKMEAERANIVRDGSYRVGLSGLGGDEFMGGNPDPREQLADLIVQFKPISLARQLAAWSLTKRRPWLHLLWQSSMTLLSPAVRAYLLKESKLEPWIDKHFAKRHHLAARRIGTGNVFSYWLPSRRACASCLVAMSNKMAKRPCSSLVPHETRYPYLDQNLIEFILSIPASQLLRPGERRSLMRRSLIGVVPPEILSRRTKQLGGRTAMVALDRHWRELQSVFETPLTAALGYVNNTALLRAACDAKNGKSVHMVYMFRAISLELWLRNVVSNGLVNIAESLIANASRPDCTTSMAAPNSLPKASASGALE